MTTQPIPPPDPDTIVCWDCDESFHSSNAEIGWTLSSFEGEEVQVYICPNCEASAYGVEVDPPPFRLVQAGKA